MMTLFKSNAYLLFTIMLFSIFLSSCEGDTTDNPAVGNKPVDQTVIDSDLDGIVDSIDLCLSTASGDYVNQNGCSTSQLDSDQDLVSDKLDQCHGTILNASVNEQGCSQAQLDAQNVNLDSDQDGVNNANDSCPETMMNLTVNAQGCAQNQLDTDKDGIFDDQDICPNTPSNQSNVADGCSQQQIDQNNAQEDDDSDSVLNANDQCPNTDANLSVDNTGCADNQLDSDQDGVFNDKDHCAATPSNQVNVANGCSQQQIDQGIQLLDDDSDSVINLNDQCPNTDANSSVDANGCAQNQIDSDNDGVYDDQDQCENTASNQNEIENGCSQAQLDELSAANDSDSDGVVNSSDVCPDTLPNQNVDQRGCADNQKDSDNDTVNDQLDQCPNTPASSVANAQGCAAVQLDDDNDGVNNLIDECPNTSANSTVDNKGCAPMASNDTDFDGVLNDVDQCPDTLPSAEVNNVGCAQSQLDTDKDGISDQDDFCGSTALGSPIDAMGCNDIDLGKIAYENNGCVSCHGDQGQGGSKTQIQNCSRTDCTNQAQLATYLTANMPTGFGSPSDCDATCSGYVSKYMIDTFVTFTNDNDKDGINNSTDQCDDTPVWLRDEIDSSGCTTPITTTPTDPNNEIYVNAGGIAVVSNINESFIADDYFTGGNTYRSMQTIENTQDQELFNTERFGEFEYDIPMENGHYEVALYFAETYHDAAALRVFDISLEGTKVLTNFDIFSDAGKQNKAVYKKFQVEITDGFLTIKSFKKTDNPKISAIKVYPKEPVVIPESDLSVGIQSVGAGAYGACAIQQNGETVCWGGNYMKGTFTENGQTKQCFVEDTSKVGSNANAYNHGNGNCVGRAVAPNNLGEALAVTAHHTGACALLKNPTAANKAIRCWGPEVNPSYPDITNPVQISGGDRQACALTSEGEVKCWVTNINYEDSVLHVAPAGLIASAVSSGGRISCAIKKSDASVVCFGEVSVTVPAGLKAKRLEVGGWAGANSEAFACAINLDDQVVCWGENGSTGKNVPNNVSATEIATAENFSCAVKMDSTVQCWGANVTAPSGSDFVDVFATRDAAVAVKSDGSVVQFKNYGTNKNIAIPNNLKVKLD